MSQLPGLVFTSVLGNFAPVVASFAPGSNSEGLRLRNGWLCSNASHLLFFSSLSFQPLRSLPLNGEMVFSSAPTTGMASATARADIARVRIMMSLRGGEWQAGTAREG